MKRHGLNDIAWVWFWWAVAIVAGCIMLGCSPATPRPVPETVIDGVIGGTREPLSVAQGFSPGNEETHANDVLCGADCRCGPDCRCFERGGQLEIERAGRDQRLLPGVRVAWVVGLVVLAFVVLGLAIRAGAQGPWFTLPWTIVLCLTLGTQAQAQCPGGVCPRPAPGVWRPSIGSHPPAARWDWSPAAAHHAAVFRVRMGNNNGGTGCVIATQGGQAVALTAAHVTAGAVSGTATFGDGATARLEVIESDPANDLAVLLLSAPEGKQFKLAAVPLAEAMPAVGQQVELCGYGGGNFRHFHALVLGVPRDGHPPGWGYDAPTISGDSGGPVIYQGRLVGVLWGGPTRWAGGPMIATHAAPVQPIRQVCQRLRGRIRWIFGGSRLPGNQGYVDPPAESIGPQEESAAAPPAIENPQSKIENDPRLALLQQSVQALAADLRAIELRPGPPGPAGPPGMRGEPGPPGADAEPGDVYQAAAEVVEEYRPSLVERAQEAAREAARGAVEQKLPGLAERLGGLVGGLVGGGVLGAVAGRLAARGIRVAIGRAVDRLRPEPIDQVIVQAPPDMPQGSVLQVPEKAIVLPPETRTVNRFVQVPDNSGEGEAYREALRREAEFSPGVAAHLQRVESVAGQILDGKQAKRAGDTPRPAWKND